MLDATVHIFICLTCILIGCSILHCYFANNNNKYKMLNICMCYTVVLTSSEEPFSSASAAICKECCSTVMSSPPYWTSAQLKIKYVIQLYMKVYSLSSMTRAGKWNNESWVVVGLAYYKWYSIPYLSYFSKISPTVSSILSSKDSISRVDRCFTYEQHRRELILHFRWCELIYK